MTGYSFTDRVRACLQQARTEALRLGHPEIGPEHILLGLLHSEGLASAAIHTLGGDEDALRRELLAVIGQGGAPLADQELPYSAGAKRALEMAMVEARDVGHNYVGTEHVLLGVVREGESPAATVLLGQGLSADRLRSKILQLLGAPAPATGSVQELPLAADPGARLRSITVLVEDAGGQVSATRFIDIDSALGHLTRLKRRA